MNAPKYTLRDLLRDFQTTTQCLEFLTQMRWPDGIWCRKCKEVYPHYYRPELKSFGCKRCGKTVSPTIGTIFHRSKVSLPDWFYAIYTMSQTRTGIAAKQLEREMDLSYKSVLLMCNKIRKALDTNTDTVLSGVCEADETYVGGLPRKRGVSKRGRGTKKQPVIGVVERGGRVVTRVVDNVRRDTILPFLQEHVEDGGVIYTDEYTAYKPLGDMGFEHETVKHKDREYVRYTNDGRHIDTNSMEGFWQSPKGAIRSVHRGVSRERMQGYFNEYAFRYSHRNAETPLFFVMLRQILAVATPYPSADECPQEHTDRDAVQSAQQHQLAA